MRLRPSEPVYSVTARTTDTGRPVRLRIAGLTFAMSPDEAITLATELADTVTTIKKEGTHE